MHWRMLVSYILSSLNCQNANPGYRGGRGVGSRYLCSAQVLKSDPCLRIICQKWVILEAILKNKDFWWNFSKSQLFAGVLLQIFLSPDGLLESNFQNWLKWPDFTCWLFYEQFWKINSFDDFFSKSQLIEHLFVMYLKSRLFGLVEVKRLIDFL